MTVDLLEKCVRRVGSLAGHTFYECLHAGAVKIVSDKQNLLRNHPEIFVLIQVKKVTPYLDKSAQKPPEAFGEVHAQQGNADDTE